MKEGLGGFYRPGSLDEGEGSLGDEKKENESSDVLEKERGDGRPDYNVLKNEQGNMRSGYEVVCEESQKKIDSLGEESVSQTFEQFARTCHDKDARSVSVAADRFIKLAEDNDSEIDVLMNSKRPGFAGGRYGAKDLLGTGEYIFEVLGSKCLPQDIGRLVTVSKTIPSSDFARFENMRMDAYRIQDKVVNGRSFIHDCAPEAHRLIEAMVDYYDAKDDAGLAEKRKTELVELLNELKTKHGAGYLEQDEKLITALANYDEIANPYSGDPVGLSKDKESEQIHAGDKGDVKVIDVLRRLKDNMEPVPLNAPKTKIPELNEAFSRLGLVPINERTGELRISVNELSGVVNAVNRHLLDNQEKRSLFPSTIAAVAYVDKLSAAALQNLSKKEWREMAFDPVFKEMVRFSQLTMGGGYSGIMFERMYDGFMHKAGEAFNEDGVDDEKISEAYSIIQAQIVQNAKAVADEFSGNEDSEYLVSAVWSGNLTHELIGLPERQNSFKQ